MSDSEWIVGANDAGARLDKFLAAANRLGSRGRAIAALERGKIYVNGAEVTIDSAGTRLSRGDTVRVWMDRPGSSRRRGPSHAGGLHILYQDDVLLVLNKPAGVLAVPLERRRESPSIYDEIEDYFRSHGKRRPFVVHRIDRDTSGLVVFARDQRTQQALKSQFRRREPERVYLAIVYGHPQPQQGTWRDRLVWDSTALIQKETHPSDPRGKDAVCRYRVVETFRSTSLIEVSLETGRRNQIRLQARLRGHTLVGERRYVYGPDALRPIPFRRQALHAYRLSFRHPAGGQLLRFEAPPPDDFAELLQKLRRAR